MKTDTKILILTFCWLLFTWAGVELIRLPFELSQIGYLYENLLMFKDLIGWIGILFGGYIATEIGKLFLTKSKEVKK